MDKIGLFLCSGCGIGDALDLDAVISESKSGTAAVVTHECLCAPEGLQAIRDAVSGGELNGIVVGACAERAKREEFASLGFDPAGIYRVPLREHCTWSHEAGDEDTRMLAEDMIKMGVARIKNCKPIEPLAEEVSDTVLVVGGGRTGLEAAKAAAALGHPVVLVEMTDALGGRLAQQKSLLPEEPPYDQPHENIMPALIEEVQGNDQIKVLTSTTIEKITGQPGQLKVHLNGSSGLEMTVGAIVQATSAKPYDASKLAHLGYGASPDVVTSTEFEAMLVDGKVVCPSSGAAPKRVLFIQCAGSRDENHLVYCSSECCSTTLRQVYELRKAAPDSEIAVVYKDIRAPVTEKPDEGVGCIEAPRGVLIHHYKSDPNGITTDVNLIVGTTNNNGPINMSVKKAASALIKDWMVSPGLLNMVEMAYRAYDPCNSCATHTLPGEMPIKAVIRKADGSVYKVVKNF